MDERGRQREVHYSYERNPRAPRTIKESAGGGSRPVVSSGERVQVARERSVAHAGEDRRAASARATSASGAASRRPRAADRKEPDYGYVGGKPARSARPSTPRVSGWSSANRKSGYSPMKGGHGAGGSSLPRVALVVAAIVVAVVLLVFVGTRVAGCVADRFNAGESGEIAALDGGDEEGSGEDAEGLLGSIPNDLTAQGDARDKLAGATETVDENGIVHGTTPAGIRYTVHGRDQAALQADKVTLVAVGDQIGTDNSLPLADRNAGSRGDGVYDFTPFYQEVAPVIQSYDLRYINQETVMAGADRGYSGYPVFNSPDACADAIAQVGFNLVNFATNHTYDMGESGIERSHEVWDRYPQLLIGGSYLTQEDRETVHMIERNGMTFAFLAYTYGDNYWGTADNFPNSYYLCGFDEVLMEADIRRAQQVADVVIVSMHWGDEYISEPNESQYEWARFLADLDVDLVLGSHAHIMQPTRYVTGESGNTIPVVFGLSDFVSGWTLVDTILSGLFTCDFVRTDDGDVEIQNLAWYPTIEWSDGGTVYVRFLKDMDEETTNANTRTDDIAWGTDYDYLRDKVNSVGMEIPVYM